MVPEEEQLNLRFVTAPLPPAGHRLRIYPPMYLQKLLDVWERPDHASRFLDWWHTIHSANRRSPNRCIRNTCPGCEPVRQQAFEFPAWRTSFLWGPPGTGKTATIGALLATFLMGNPGKRVLLLSTTNSAVDQALIAVDEVLKQMTPQETRAGILRRACSRIGNHFLAGNYHGREHLLPIKDISLVHVLADLETKAPEKGRRSGV